MPRATAPVPQSHTWNYSTAQTSVGVFYLFLFFSLYSSFFLERFPGNIFFPGGTVELRIATA